MMCQWMILKEFSSFVSIYKKWVKNKRKKEKISIDRYIYD